MIIGKRISGRYRIEKMIGGGGMANVYLAHDMILDRDVAVKILRFDSSNEEEFIKRFQREAQAATSLAHSNIVSIYDVGEDDEIYYIVMEYVKGYTLKEYIQQNHPLSLTIAVHIMQQIVSAIDHAHEHNIIHRDIKPQNILIDEHGTAKITDFGIATALSATTITQTNSVLGSVHYLSPEQARGGMATKKSDIYSLGIVFFELITGRLPFSGESAVSIALKHLQSETPSVRRWNANIPQSIENIIFKATAKDPFVRYETAGKMEEDLETALDPSRLDESPFIVPLDDDATKAIPVITKEAANNHLDETMVHTKNEKTIPHPVSSKLEEERPKVKTKKKKWIVPTLLLFLLLVGLGIAFAMITAPKEIEVPITEDMELNDALDELTALGFEIGEVIEQNSDEIEDGKVIKTDPKAGTMLLEGEEIDVFVSSGKEAIEMKDYVGNRVEQVNRILESAGFEVEVEEEFSDDPIGTIVSQTPESGDMVIPEDTIVTLIVSKGEAPVEVKNLTGFNDQALRDYAESSGLTIDLSNEEYSDEVQAGTVISQDPKPGTAVEKGSVISVVLSKGPKEVPPKEVQKEVFIPYEPEEDGKPQEVIIYIQDMNRNMVTPSDSFYITQGETRILTFTVREGETAGYRIFRDGQVIEEDVIEFPKSN
ncbi:Stk1 family PASTA domain-containing Ser/Thr kinase [Mangrovibacillus cuniculi]|uniref:Serine/threonine-protein kinase PrkC n=1 Tax=Mangrovibacillus cuniculi TaxID=2593652 RepID=A0A7S8CAA6_9BACI|nr:Stk1 family PASTA domain-containing Ser/Thr kinase [Mangrovibacillus cuniculi]QPC46300.1 Stk1 family PASTA domain-containing Ser/Thr kinase [Mangrovibacillus cuniculi]